MNVSYNFNLSFVNIIIMVYLIVDAPKRGKNQILWAILGFFFGTIALSIYLFRTGRAYWGMVWLIISALYILGIVGFTYYVLHQMIHVF